MEIILLYLILCIIIGVIGSKRNIGFLGGFFLSLFLSPFVGLLFTLISEEKEEHEPSIRHYSPTKTQTVEPGSKNNQHSKLDIITELEKLQSLKEEGVITQQEFQILKNKIINLENNSMVSNA